MTETQLMIGVTDIGENRVQDARRKQETFGARAFDDVRRFTAGAPRTTTSRSCA